MSELSDYKRLVSDPHIARLEATIRELRERVAEMEAAGPSQHREPIEADREAAEIADRVVLDVSELPDRTSPDDWPDAMLVTGEELRTIVFSAIAAHRLAFSTPAASEHIADAGKMVAASGAEAVERIVQTIYEKRPFKVISQALADATGLPMGAAIPWEAANAAGADHSGLRRIVTEALAALPLPKAGEGEAMTELQRLGQEFDAGED